MQDYIAIVLPMAKGSFYAKSTRKNDDHHRFVQNLVCAHILIR